MNRETPISLLVCALGGEGGGVLTEWLVETARLAGHAAQATSIPGVAQRTGATTYYLEVFPLPLEQLAGRRPVFGLNPVPGALDALVSSELLETVRQIGNGMASAERTLVISSSARALTTLERMQMGDGRLDSERLLGVVREFSRQQHVFDMGALARAQGTVVSAVMLGAIAASGLLPFRREHFEGVVRDSGASAAASLRGFAAGFERVTGPAATETAATVPVNVKAENVTAEEAPGLPPELARQFPAAIHAMLALGHARLLDHQDPAYAALYLRRLAGVLEAERAADPQAEQGFALTNEMARWLALWMAYDDIVRVADLKSRASRWQRVRREVRVGDDELLRVYDHFKPGVPEFAGLLPQSLAGRLLAWERARVGQGKPAWALPIKLGSHSVLGMLALRLLASLKWLRVRGSRHAQEQAMIERWLAGVTAGTGRDWRLGHELALCGRLIKGYGATHERGKDNLLHVLDHLARGDDPAQAAAAVAAARQAALADEGGKALDALLLAQGAPARPLKEQPIRWMRRPQKT